MTRVVADISVSLYGFVAGPNPGPDNGLGDGGDALHTWAFSDDLDELRKAQARGGQAIELQRQHEEIRDLREDLHFKEIEIKELKASLERQDKAAIQISRSNAHLRSEIYDVKCARDAYRQDGIELRDLVTEIRRALDDYDNEED